MKSPAMFGRALSFGPSKKYLKHFFKFLRTTVPNEMIVFHFTGHPLITL